MADDDKPFLCYQPGCGMVNNIHIVIVLDKTLFTI